MKKKIILNAAAVIFTALSFSNLGSTTFAMESKSNVLTLNNGNIKKIKQDILAQKAKLKNLFWQNDIVFQNNIISKEKKPCFLDLDFIDKLNASDLAKHIQNTKKISENKQLKIEINKIMTNIRKLEKKIEK